MWARHWSRRSWRVQNLPTWGNCHDPRAHSEAWCRGGQSGGCKKKQDENRQKVTKTAQKVCFRSRQLRVAVTTHEHILRLDFAVDNPVTAKLEMRWKQTKADENSTQKVFLGCDNLWQLSWSQEAYSVAWCRGGQIDGWGKKTDGNETDISWRKEHKPCVYGSQQLEQKHSCHNP